MSEPIKRRNLFPISEQPSSLPQEEIAAVAARNGFPDLSPQPAAPTDSNGARRQRQPTGRNHQFNTRLRRDTLDLIYSEANARNIPIAQVIEEAMDALKSLRPR